MSPGLYYQYLSSAKFHTNHFLHALGNPPGTSHSTRATIVSLSRPLYWLNGKKTYQNIARYFEPARYEFKIVRSFWNLTDVSEPVLQNRFSLSRHRDNLTYLPYCRIYALKNWVSNGSDNGLSPVWCQAITWTNAGLLLTWPIWTNFVEIQIKIQFIFIHEN